MTIVSVMARVMTVNKTEGKTDATLISVGENKNFKVTCRLKIERSYKKKKKKMAKVTPVSLRNSKW